MIEVLFRVSIVLIVLLHGAASVCPPHEYTCPSDGSCIRKEYVCDGAQDCRMTGDENREGGCLSTINGTEQCVNGLYTCKSSLQSNKKPFCLPYSARCDGRADCYYGEDELNCSGLAPVNPCNSTRQMFRCRNGQCIPKNVQCDGLSDCPSKVDENNCTYPVCSSSTFKCSYGYCIPANKTCDGLWDCRDGSDETEALCDGAKACERNNTNIYCPGNTPTNRCIKMTQFCSGALACNSSKYVRGMCSFNNCFCGANGKCVQFLIGYDCLCNPGYEKVVNSNGNITCRDINECNNITKCDQLCQNTDGGFKCLCNSGFISSSANPRYCLRMDTSVEPIILFANRYRIRRLNINGSSYGDIDSSISSVNVLDFDWPSKSVYYNEYNDNLIKVIKLTEASTSVVQYTNAKNIEGIALDWIARKLYWTSSVQQGIFVSELDGRYTAIVVNNGSPECRGIALVPSMGYLFWTDWGTSPFIGRASMDGKSEIVKIVANNIYWPNGVTIDYLGRRVYWVDAYKDTIEVCDYNGKNRMIILTSPSTHPFGIVVFDNYIYWTDWTTRAIIKVDKLTGENMTVLLDGLLVTPFDLKVFHPARQPIGPNPCAIGNGGCSHLCLIGEGGVASCVCPITFFLMADNRTCHVQCNNVTQYRCRGSNPVCIAWYKVCNGAKDCDESDDEPASCGKRICSPSSFQCANATNANSTSCISLLDVCDGRINCPDMSDEVTAFCQNRQCESNQFLCNGTGRCIPNDWVCDEDNDCKYGEDEAPNNPKCSKCSSTQVQCDNKKCIDADWYCDFDDDCGDQSDEPSSCWAYRARNPCADGLVRCPMNYRCVWASAFCDKADDCRDNSDEANCTAACRTNEFACVGGGCIPLRWKCNFNDECPDSSDEDPTTCASVFVPCQTNEFNCSNHKCVDQTRQCDGFNDCGDLSDEIECKPHCPELYFQCTEDNSCLFLQLKCNGHYNCPDGSDEQNCPTLGPNVTCNSNQFQCSNKLCVNTFYVCDNYTDCTDGSDESPAVCKQYSCGPDEFHCRKINRCISKDKVCDGTMDCNFGADEDPSICNGNCLKTQFQCQSGECIPDNLRCNLHDDCGGGEDEDDCAEPSCDYCAMNCTETFNVAHLSLGFRCSCDLPGYTRDPENRRRCVDVDECQVLQMNMCPQECVNFVDPAVRFKCQCGSAFTDVYHNGSLCRSIEGYKGSAVYASYNNIELSNLTSGLGFQISTLSTAPVLAIEVDSVHKVIYHVRGSAVFRELVPELAGQVPVPQKIMELNTTDLLEAPPLAVDWQNQNIYYSDITGIKVTNVKAGFKPYTLPSGKTYNQISSIALLPVIGKLYFTYTSDGMGYISVMNMSGIGQVEVILNKNLINPVSLTIDYNMLSFKSWSSQVVRYGRMYWVNRHIGNVETANFDGSDRFEVFHFNDGSRIYSIDAFSGQLYVTMDPARNYVALINSTEATMWESGIHLMYPIRLVKIAHQNKYGDLGSSSGCDLPTGRICTMCLPSSSFDFKCVCPDGVSFVRGSNVTCSPSAVVVPEMSMCYCNNVGSCVVNRDSEEYYCRCPNGFSGIHCEFSLSTISRTASTNTPYATPSNFSTTYTVSTISSIPFVSTTSTTPTISTASTFSTDFTFSTNSTVFTDTSVTPSLPQPSVSMSSIQTSPFLFSPNEKKDEGTILGIVLGVILGGLCLIGLLIFGIYYFHKKKLWLFANTYQRQTDVPRNIVERTNSLTVHYENDGANLRSSISDLSEIYSKYPNQTIGEESKA